MEQLIQNLVAPTQTSKEHVQVLARRSSVCGGYNLWYMA